MSQIYDGMKYQWRVDGFGPQDVIIYVVLHNHIILLLFSCVFIFTHATDRWLTHSLRIGLPLFSE